MKNSTLVLLTAFFSATSPSHASMKYECWSYKSGDLGKMTYVTADNNDEAVQLAAVKFDDLSVTYDNVKCK